MTSAIGRREKKGNIFGRRKKPPPLLKNQTQKRKKKKKTSSRNALRERQENLPRPHSAHEENSAGAMAEPRRKKRKVAARSALSNCMFSDGGKGSKSVTRAEPLRKGRSCKALVCIESFHWGEKATYCQDGEGEVCVSGDAGRPSSGAPTCLNGRGRRRKAEIRF